MAKQKRWTRILEELKNSENISVNELIYTNLSTNYNIIVYVDKLIDNIELISNDEQTSYNKINCSSLEINKYYSITQRVKVK